MEDTMRDLLSKLDAIEQQQESILPEVGDAFGISLSEDSEIATEIVGFTTDGIVVEIDDHAEGILESQGVRFFDGQLTAGVTEDGLPSWTPLQESGLQYYLGKKKFGKDGMAALAKAGKEGASEEELGRIKDKYKKEDSDIEEAEYQGRNVPLGKKMPGDVKKYKVYVRKPNGNVVKVNFGDKKMRIKKSNPARRKSFRARHNCKNPGPRWKARYWSCRNW
jgi:hypothetical protein